MKSSLPHQESSVILIFEVGSAIYLDSLVSEVSSAMSRMSCHLNQYSSSSSKTQVTLISEVLSTISGIHSHPFSESGSAINLDPWSSSFSQLVLKCQAFVLGIPCKSILSKPFSSVMSGLSSKWIICHFYACRPVNLVKFSLHHLDSSVVNLFPHP